MKHRRRNQRRGLLSAAGLATCVAVPLLAGAAPLFSTAALPGPAVPAPVSRAGDGTGPPRPQVTRYVGRAGHAGRPVAVPPFPAPVPGSTPGPDGTAGPDAGHAGERKAGRHEPGRGTASRAERGTEAGAGMRPARRGTSSRVAGDLSHPDAGRRPSRTEGEPGRPATAPGTRPGPGHPVAPAGTVAFSTGEQGHPPWRKRPAGPLKDLVGDPVKDLVDGLTGRSGTGRDQAGKGAVANRPAVTAPEPDLAPGADPKPGLDLKPDLKPDLDTKPDLKPGPEPGPGPGLVPGPKPEVKPEPKPGPPTVAPPAPSPSPSSSASRSSAPAPTPSRPVPVPPAAPVSVVPEAFATPAPSRTRTPRPRPSARTPSLPPLVRQRLVLDRYAARRKGTDRTLVLVVMFTGVISVTAVAALNGRAHR
ncbi:hypothetical protein GCM10017559_23770 [Streptosporangium longisporum]|uniref:Uncharacterized protein n=1 Tax=Streptosporangium longisporum TaxID=46187 RepID=A0ABP6KFK2_9ACTN